MATRKGDSCVSTPEHKRLSSSSSSSETAHTLALSRRQVLGVGVLAVGTLVAGCGSVESGSAHSTPVNASQLWNWTYSRSNPVLRVSPGWDSEATYDPWAVRRSDGSLWLYYSTRGRRPLSIGLAIDGSGEGDALTNVPNPVCMPPADTAYGLSRPSVIQQPDGTWRLWYSTTGTIPCWIGTATSSDGRLWILDGGPVLEPVYAWEKQAVQCPNVWLDAASGVYHMWYSGGDEYEPDAIGHATSPDGLVWSRTSEHPIFSPMAGTWEDYKVGSFAAQRVGDWFYAFYNAFHAQPFVSQVGIARSRDGVTNWIRNPANPILTPGQPGSWDAGMTYKPCALWDGVRQRWDVWFNAAAKLGGIEQIGHAWSMGVW
jgi:beta-1,2-mannobiose phosphorylase / 1,2-beta-oligomannan phosphorylase